MNIPPVIYKFQGTDSIYLQNLKNASIFFNSPLNFNDPFDCNVNFNPVLSEHNFEELINTPEAFHDKYNFKLLEKCGIQKEEYYEKLLLITKAAITQQIEINRNKLGVSCFSESNQNLLMWSHYADKGKGFCLEFDTNCNLFSKSKKVLYTNETVTFDIDLLLRKGKEDELKEKLLLGLITKSIDWKYEREWRIIHQNQNHLFTYELSSLKGIYFGPRVEQSFLEIVCLIIQGQSPSVRFYRGIQSDVKFEIEFTEFTYTPYIHNK